MAGGVQQLPHVQTQVYRVAAVDLDGLPCAGCQQVVEHPGVFLLLPGGEAEHVRNQAQAVVLRHLGGEEVAAAGLAFPGEGPHQVQAGAAVVEVNGTHGKTSLYG